MVLVVEVVVVICGVASVLEFPVEADSGVLRVVVGVWGCAFMCGGGVVCVLVVVVVWCGWGVVDVVAIVDFGCVGVGGCFGGWWVLAMVLCFYIWGCYVVVVVVVVWFR
jgi:hypothetical protein